MSVRQVGAETLDSFCIFYSESFLVPLATFTLPPTPSDQYIISSHNAHMHIYREKVDNKDRLVGRACGCFSGTWSHLLSSKVIWILIKEVKRFLHPSHSCMCVGVPVPRIEWFKDSVPLSKLANPRYKVTTAAGLTVRRVQPGDGGIFQCLARNAAGETQVYTQLLVSSEFDYYMHMHTHTCARTQIFMGDPKVHQEEMKGAM